MSAAHKGQVVPPDVRRRISEAQRAERSPAWKGDAAGYVTKHRWMLRHYKKNGVCEHCGAEAKTHWANKDHRYRRVREDWLELCPKCHKAYDATIP